MKNMALGKIENYINLGIYRKYKMKKILVRAPVLSRSGYGEQARFALRALRSRPDLYDVYILPINWGKTGWINDDDEERDWIDSMIGKTNMLHQSGIQYDATLQVTIPNEFEKAAPINIGYTAGIETTAVAPVWLEQANIMDRIIVVSNHSKNVFQDTTYTGKHKKTDEVVRLTCDVPVDVVGYPVRKFKSEKLDLNLEYDFNFLVVAQWGPRKNLGNTIKWFLDEFKDDEVGLVLKVNVAKNSTIDKHASLRKLKENLNKYEDRSCKVYLLHGDMTDEEMSGLYNHSQIKALINLSHGEGYGLPIFEAVYNGLPVVTVGWSGQMDFLYAPFYDKKKKKKVIKPHFASVSYTLKPISKEAVWPGVLEENSRWCYANEMDYKNKIRDVYKSYGKYKKMATNLKGHVEESFSPRIIYENFVNSIEKCFEGMPQQDEKIEVMVL